MISELFGVVSGQFSSLEMEVEYKPQASRLEGEGS